LVASRTVKLSPSVVLRLPPTLSTPLALCSSSWSHLCYTTINIFNFVVMPNVPIMPVVPIIMPNSQAHEPFEWLSSDKNESHTWRTDEDGLKCITVTRVTTDVYESWTCTR